MTKFEQKGISYQHSALSKEDAIKSFQHSCDCCALRGMRIECDRCAIAVVHKLTIAIFEDKKGE